MQNARNQNASRGLTVKHYMPAVLRAPQGRANIVTRPTRRWTIGEHLAARLQAVDVTDSLLYSPSAESIISDRQQIGFGAPREPEERHKLAQSQWKIEGFSDPSKNVCLGNTTRIAFIDGGAKRG